MNKEIKKFIEQSMQEIAASLPDGYHLQESMTFDLLFKVKKKKSGKVKLVLADKNGSEEDIMHRITFSIQQPQHQLSQIQNTAEAIMGYVRKGLMEFTQTAQLLSPHPEKKAIKAKEEPKIPENKAPIKRKTATTSKKQD